MSYSMHYPPVWFFHLILKVDADIISNAELWCVENSVWPPRNGKIGPEISRFSSSSPISPLLSHPLSKDCGQTDMCPFPLGSNLCVILSGEISAVWLIFINAFVLNLQGRCSMALRVFGRGHHGLGCLSNKHLYSTQTVHVLKYWHR